jgi:hypothetical protein
MMTDEKEDTVELDEATTEQLVDLLQHVLATPPEGIWGRATHPQHPTLQ